METTTTEMVKANGARAAAMMPVIETAAAGVAAQMEAAIKARYALARMAPRDIDQVRGRLIKACQRPRFAESARYRLPRMKEVTDQRTGHTKKVPIEGPSIRFAEEVARSVGNVAVESTIVHDDADRRVVRVTVTDVEANLPISQDVVIEKFTERSKLRDGQHAISSRTNKAGRTVYRVEIDENDMALKQASLTARVRRNLILQVLPSDVLDEAMEACVATMASEDAKDPDATRKGIFDRFQSVGVTPADLKAYVGNDMAHVDRPLWEELRNLFTAIKEGDTTWAEVMASREAEAKAAEAPAPGDKPRTAKELAEQRKAKKAAKTAEAAPAQAPEAKQEATAAAPTRCEHCSAEPGAAHADGCPNFDLGPQQAGPEPQKA